MWGCGNRSYHIWMNQFEDLDNSSFLPLVKLALCMLSNNASLACSLGKFDVTKPFNTIFLDQCLYISIFEVPKPLIPYFIDFIGIWQKRICRGVREKVWKLVDIGLLICNIECNQFANRIFRNFHVLLSECYSLGWTYVGNLVDR